MLCFYFLFILKKTDVIGIKTRNKVQIESASATATPNNTIIKKKSKPLSSTDDVHRLPLRETGLPNGSL